MLNIMNSKQQWRIIGIIMLTLVFVAGVASYIGGARLSDENLSKTESITGSISLTIEGLYADKSVPVSQDETVLEVLQKLDATDTTLQLLTKEYSGLGTLVIGMRGWENGTGGKYWQYKVNGRMPQIGAGAYTLKDGDAVEWYFGPSLF